MLNPAHIDALVLDHPDAVMRSGSGPVFTGPLTGLHRRVGDRGIHVFPFPAPDPAAHKTPLELLRGALHWLDVEANRAAILTPRPEVAEAARTCELALVCGLAQRDKESPLRKAGVHLVARRPEDVDLIELQPRSAFENLETIRATFFEFEPTVMLDYDGTLTPIVDDPARALLSSETRAVLLKLATVYPTAVVSGRDLRDVESLVGAEGIWYVGSHGSEFRGPTGELTRPGMPDSTSDLTAVARELSERLTGIPGAQIERKQSALAVHYRRVSPGRIPEVERIVADVVGNTEGLMIGHGKMVLEVQPHTAWDKGNAVQWLLTESGVDLTRAVPLYIGDDITDENAFRSVKPNGIGILVSDAPRPTFADYRLTDPGEVRRFLSKLLGD